MLLPTSSQNTPDRLRHLPKAMRSQRQSSDNTNDTRYSFATAKHSLSPISPALEARSVSPGPSDLSSSCSSTASSFLTPPRAPADGSDIPWKAPSPDDPSLKMLPCRRRRSSTEFRVGRRKKAKRYRKHYCHAHRNAEARTVAASQRRPSHKWLPVQSGARNSGLDCRSDHGESQKALSRLTEVPDCKVPDPTPEELRSGLAEPIISRSWTSVGLDASRPRTSKDVNNAVGHDDGRALSESDRHRDMLSTICARLAARRVSVDHLETPASITLRRASMVKPSQPMKRLASIADALSGAATPIPSGVLMETIDWESIKGSHPLAVYLITNQDIDQVAELIQNTFAQDERFPSDQIVLKELVQMNSPDPSITRRPSVTGKGIMPQSNGIAHLATTVAITDARPMEVHTDKSRRRKSSTVQRVYTENGVNEIIWEESSSDSSPASPDCPRISHLPGSAPTTERQEYPYASHDSLMDNSIAPSSVKGWTWIPSSAHGTKVKENAISKAYLAKSSRLVVNSDSDSNCLYSQGFDGRIGPNGSHGLTHSQNEAATRNTPRLRINSNPLDAAMDTISSGKNIDINAESSDVSNRKAVSAPNSAHSTETSREEGSSNGASNRQLPRSQSSSSFPSQSVHRTGVIFKLGSAIGSSSHARRRSSAQIQRGRMSSIQDKIARFDEDNLNSTERRKTWKKPRKDSGWPGVTEIISPSSSRTNSGLSEYEVDLDGSAGRYHDGAINGIERQKEWAVGRQADRKMLLDQKDTPFMEPDRAGIYAIMSGSRREDEDRQGSGGPGNREFHVCGESIPGTRNPSVDWIA